MANPLAQYVWPAPYFDYTDARTWHDGLWGGGQWPPEGFPGHPEIHGMSGLGSNNLVFLNPNARTWMPGDRARLQAGGLWGLGQTDTSSLPGSPSLTIPGADTAPVATSTGTDSSGDLPLVSMTPTQQQQYTQLVTQAAAQTMQQQASQSQTLGTWILVGGGAAVLILIFAMNARKR